MERPLAAPVRSHPLEHHNSTGRVRRLGTAAQDGPRFTIGPVVQHPSEQIEIRTGRQWVEEALPDRCDPLGDTGRLENLA